MKLRRIEIRLAAMAAVAVLGLFGPAKAQTPGVYDAVANPKAIVGEGHARFTVLTAQLLRVEWSADGKFEDHPTFTFLNRNLPVPAFEVKRENGALTITTAALTLTYNASKAADGKFTADDLSITLSVEGKPVVWHPGMKDSANLMGAAYTLDRAVGSQLAYGSVEQGLVSRSGWAMVDDTTTPLFTSDDFSFPQGEKSAWPWEQLRPTGERQDWYFFGYGHDYKLALGDFTKVAGKIPLPPRYIFGAWWTRYWPYTDQDLLGLVETYRSNNIPLDVMVIDMDWHINSRQLTAMKDKYPTGFATKDTKTADIPSGGFDASGARLGWTGYTWDTADFPYPEEFLQQLHREGVKVTMNLHPASGVMPWEKAYPEMARAMGIDPATQKFVPFEMLSQKYAQNYFDLLHHPLEKQGVDFWWLDWQPAHEVIQTPGINSTFWLNYIHFTDQQREGKRPMLFGRWGGLGNHRYETGFSGDVIIGWDSLAYQPAFTATSANVGYAYWSHDIGGHIPGPTEPEMYTRWVQWGAFSPVLRTHAAINPWGERRIWAYPEPYSDVMKNVFRDRYALIPYIYTEARRTYDNGVSFLRPLYYNWPEANEAYDNKNEYQFGDEMLVAPVTQPVDTKTQLAEVKTWVPPGEWIEAQTGQRFTGPKEVDASYSLGDIPRYMKAGAIVPMAPPMLSSEEKPVDPLIVQVYPMDDGQQSEYTLYADGGDGEKYQTGETAWTKLTAQRNGPQLIVHVAAIEGTYPGMPQQRGYQLRLPGEWPPLSVTANGKPLTQQIDASKPGWTYDGNQLMTIITVPRESVRKAVDIKVSFAPELSASRCKLAGVPGVLARLHEAELMMTDEQPIAQPPDALTIAKETGQRLTYHPETAKQEIDRLLADFPLVLPAVQQAQQGAEAKIPKAVEHVVPDTKSAEFRDHAAAYANRITGMVAAVKDAATMLPQCLVH